MIRAEGARPALLLLALLGPALLAAIAYAPALRSGFVSDDAVLIAGNPAVRSLGAALEGFGRSYWHGLKEVAPYYRPLPVVSYALDHAAFGLDPAFYHATNVVLHASCAALAAFLAAALARRRAAQTPPSATAVLPCAAMAGSLAAVHPLHSECAAAIYGRPDLLAAFFALAFLNLAARGHALAGTACLAGALFSKESALLLPFLAPVALAMAPPGRTGHARARKVVIGALAALLVLGLYLALRHRALAAFYDPSAVTQLDNPLVHASPVERRLTPVAVAARYAALWLRPARLCADRGFDTVPLVTSATDPAFLGGAILLAGAAAVITALAARRSVWSLPAAAAALAYLPASNFLLLAPVLMAERLAYLPSLFVCVLAGAVYGRLASSPAGPGVAAPGWPFGRWGMHAAAAVLVVLAGARAFARAADFRDDLSLHASTVAACPRSVKAQYDLGNALARARRDAEAIEAFRSAVAIAPWLAVAHNNLGTSYLNLRRLDDAASAYRRAIEESPSLFNPHANLAMVLYLEGHLEEALSEARTALSLGPAESDAEQLGELIRRIERRLEVTPASPRAP